MRIPDKLKPGDRVAVLAPASPAEEEEREKAFKAVCTFGLEPVIYESACSAHGYLAGSDQLRADDLNCAFSDDGIRGIWCLRGGYGSPRIRRLIDWETVRNHPKFFAGYSDITALHTVMNRCCDMVTWHAPMVKELGQGLDPYTLEQLKRALFGSLEGPIPMPEGVHPYAMSGGQAEGTLVGGNLELIASALGTPYEIDTQGKILFLEEINEGPWGIDGSLAQMRDSGKLKDAAGIVLGRFLNCDDETQEFMRLEEVLSDYFTGLGIPVLADLPCGHGTPTCSLPLGAMARLDADRGELILLEG